MKILIIDDSAIMRQIIAQVILENVRTEPTILNAGDGEAALEILTEHDVDVIFVDWNMPVLDGLSFVKMVRAKDTKTPIIMISAFTDADKVYTAVKAGVNSYIEKPVRGSELWDSIKSVLEEGA